MELIRIDRLISSHDSWESLFEELSTNKDFTTKFKGDVFERLTQAYLLTIPEYKSELTNVWLNEEVPAQVLKKLNLPSKDFGVDLIVKTRRNEYWTIQCKFKSTNNALTYKELSTFSTLSFVTARNIKLALVAHTSAKPIRNRDKLGNVSEIGLGRWLTLDDEEWNNIRKFCKRKPIKIAKRTPRPHQREAIKCSKQYFLKEGKSRGKLIMPCATGKSLTAFWIAKTLEAKSIIVAVPSLALIKQSLNDWTKEYMAYGITPDWLCVCSDETAGKVEIDEFNTDTYDLGIPTTTKKEEITQFIKRRSKNPKIIFTTYQSSPRLASAAKSNRSTFDLAILDEAHKTVGSKSKTFSTLLSDERIKVKKRLFMTATERVLRGKDDEVASMDDPKLYGGFVYEMTFKEAIERDIISDYKVVSIGISDSQVRELVETNRFLDPELGKLEEASAQNLASGVALKKAFKKHKIKHAISFHRSINLAKKFQKQQDELNNVKSLTPKVQNLHISSKKSSGERVKLIKEFIQFDRSLLTNARCLTEGVDVPAIDCVMFVDPKQSVVDIVQASGRALRKHEGKKFGYILLPLVVPDDMDIEEFSETTAFKTITRIVAALSSQDERIAEEFRLEKHGRTSSGTIINIDVDLKLGKKIDISKFSDSINTKIWEKVAKVNYRNYEFSRDYARGLGLRNYTEWREHTKNPEFPKDIPKDSITFYKGKGWIDVADFLGTSFVSTSKRKYRSFKEARKYARSQNLKSRSEWKEHTKEQGFPKDIPVDVEQFYNDEWTSMGDFLGTGYVATSLRKYRSFKEARKYARSLNLKSYEEWREHTKSPGFPTDFHKDPIRFYKDKGWIDVSDFLGTSYVSTKKRKYRSFKEARDYVRSIGLKNTEEWLEFSSSDEHPEDIPTNPHTVYKNEGWVGMPDWLGNKNRNRGIPYKSFKEARKYARSLNLKSYEEWREHTKSPGFPTDFHKDPIRFYKDKGWIDVSDFLGYTKKLNKKKK